MPSLLYVYGLTPLLADKLTLPLLFPQLGCVEVPDKLKLDEALVKLTVVVLTQPFASFT